MTDAGDSFWITPASTTAEATALVFASPHSGDRYPEDMGAAPGLTPASLRSAEDALVGRLIAEGPRSGGPADRAAEPEADRVGPALKRRAGTRTRSR